jgi:hypothetical protein
MLEAGPRQRLSAPQLIEGHALAALVDFLHRRGILDDLAKGRTTGAIARRNRFSGERLELALEAVAARTDILRRAGKSYRLARGYARYESLGHLLDKYLGAFGPCLLDPGRALSRRAAGAAARLVDRKRHAAAFSRIEPVSSPTIRALIREFNLSPLLELGCGPASELIGAALDSPSFRGIGVEANTHMVKTGKSRIAAHAVEKRVRICQADCRRLAAAIPAPVRRQVRGLLASSYLNELFDSELEAAGFLRQVKRLFPGAMMIIRDYYGSLRSRRRSRPGAIVHDIAQLVSRQGVPPSHHAGWRRIYRSAGCRLVRHIEGAGPVPWFIDVVIL